MVAGDGYVGLVFAVLLTLNQEVTVIMTKEAKIVKLNKFINSIQDDIIENFIKKKYRKSILLTDE